MAESYQYRSALAPLGLAANAIPLSQAQAAVRLSEVVPGRQLNLRADPGNVALLAGVEKQLGAALPETPNRVASSSGVNALWLGPDEWLLVFEDDAAKTIRKLEKLCAKHGASLTDVSDARGVVRVAGERARDVLAKGCSLDLHERGFEAGSCAQSTIALCQVVLQRLPDDGAGPVYQLYAGRSFAIYLWEWLTDASLEYGLEVTAAA